MIEANGLMVFYENMLALNNVAIKCDEDQIVGVFGANSAGKSTLMYMLSGIIEDIRKKEDMAGGERISILGNIKYLGEEIMGMKPGSAGRTQAPREDAAFSRNARCWKICGSADISLPPSRPKKRWIMYSKLSRLWRSFKKGSADF